VSWLGHWFSVRAAASGGSSGAHESSADVAFDQSPRPNDGAFTKTLKRLAFVVSHPIQYYAPLYQRLSARGDIQLKVFFTWHDGRQEVVDPGFGRPVQWDVPLTAGYDYELVANQSRRPGTDHFFGLQNRDLVQRILAWQPDAVHVTGWAWQSHLLCLRALAKKGVFVIFRGDSHLLDQPERSGARWLMKRAVLTRVFSWPDVFLTVGRANCAYFQAFGVRDEKLCPCPHSIDVARFARPADTYDAEARQWRHRLGIPDNACAVLFAGKFEARKRPLELMEAVQACDDKRVVLIMLGDGALKEEVEAKAAARPDRFRVLPFQNQSRMPVAYRLGDLFALPSAYGETWGLAVNEAMASGRPVLVSNKVGCASDVVDEATGRIFPWEQPAVIGSIVSELAAKPSRLREMGVAAARRAWKFDLARTEEATVECLTNSWTTDQHRGRVPTSIGLIP
jgi:glycosyltransferase involved in cell wall biosynthesis